MTINRTKAIKVKSKLYFVTFTIRAKITIYPTLERCIGRSYLYQCIRMETSGQYVALIIGRASKRGRLVRKLVYQLNVAQVISEQLFLDANSSSRIRIIRQSADWLR